MVTKWSLYGDEVEFVLLRSGVYMVTKWSLYGDEVEFIW